MILVGSNEKSLAEYFDGKDMKNYRQQVTNIREYARDVVKRLKWNRSSDVTDVSHNIIKRADEYFSRSDVPVEMIGAFMTVVANCDYQNVAISSCLCHLFYLRIWRYAFRIIKGKDIKSNFLALMAVSGGRLSKYLFNQFKPAQMAKIKSHKDFMTFMFANVKATATMEEMFQIRQIYRYWSNHPARRNRHHIYRAWC